MAASSSMTWTVLPVAIGKLLGGHNGKGKPENSTTIAVRLHAHLAAMIFHDGARYREADAHALRLCRDKRLKQLRGDLRSDAAPSIRDGYFKEVRIVGCARYQQLLANGRFHGLHGVSDE